MGSYYSKKLAVDVLELGVHSSCGASGRSLWGVPHSSCSGKKQPRAFPFMSGFLLESRTSRLTSQVCAPGDE